MKTRYFNLNIWLAAWTMILTAGCKKLVDVPAPVTSINSANVFSTDATAIAALTGIYTQISQGSFNIGSIPSSSLYLGLAADELTLNNGTASITPNLFYQNRLTNATPGGGDFLWNNYYSAIYTANASIAGIGGSNTLTPAVAQELLGEAYFIRAFSYFYLTNLYGDVPIPLTTDYSQTALLSRTAQKQVYQQIIADLLQAQKLLPTTYVDGTVLKTSSDRTRPNHWTATALLARTYMYSGDNADAITQATSIINNTGLFGLSALKNTFLRASLGNNEAIWQLQSVYTGSGTYNTPDALFFVLPATGPSTITTNFAYLSPFMLSSFEAGDQRYANWVNSVTVGGTTYYYPYKYKVNSPTATATEWEVVFRLAEQYLIRAEAEIGTNPVQSVADLNVIRARAGLPNYAGASDAASLQKAVLHERQVEFFTEWGHRWLDLKRTGTVNSVMGSPGNVCAAKGGSWNSNLQLLPIPLPELQHDPNLTQNQGY